MDLRGGEQARRRRQSWRGAGREVAGRRLHPGDRPDQQPRDQSDALREAALRPAQGSEPGRAYRLGSGGARCRAEFALRIIGRFARCGEDRSGRGHVRIAGERHGVSSDRRAPAARRRRQAHARALQGSVAGADRHPGRPGAIVYVLGSFCPFADQGGETARNRGDFRQAGAGAARGPHDRRIRLQGFRSEHLVRPARAGRDADDYHRKAERRGEPLAQDGRSTREARGRRRRGAGRFTGTICIVPQGRARQVGTRRSGIRCQGGMNRAMAQPKKRDYTPQTRGALRGVRVLDLSRLVAGNTLTQVLADFGAEVIKVEPPAGDTLRAWQTNGVPVTWKLYARSKKSLCLELRRPEARALLLDLVPSAAIFIESFRPGTLEKMNLAPEVLFARNPKLVVLRISGWGQDGPYRRRPGFGTLIEGMSGFASMNGFADREPVLPPMYLADSVAGLYGASAAMIALREVEPGGGKGQVIDLPLLEPLFNIMGPQAAVLRLTGKVKPRTGNRSTNTAPRNAYRTKDEHWVCLSASIQKMAERLFRAIGRPELIEDPRYATNPRRVRQAPQVTAGERTADSPDPGMGAFPFPRVGPRLGGTPGASGAPAPGLGEQTRALPAEAGVDEAA